MMSSAMNKFAVEVSALEVRMVLDQEEEYPSR
jgi:hypothetical protein